MHCIDIRGVSLNVSYPHEVEPARQSNPRHILNVQIVVDHLLCARLGAEHVWSYHPELGNVYICPPAWRGFPDDLRLRFRLGLRLWFGFWFRLRFWFGLEIWFWFWFCFSWSCRLLFTLLASSGSFTRLPGIRQTFIGG
jgi:hypothetical protein